MTDAAKLEMLKGLLMVKDCDHETDVRLGIYLQMSAQAILSRMYILVDGGIPKNATVPPEYEITQVHACIAGFNATGAEGQIDRTENGIRAEFKYEDMVAYIDGHIMPYLGVRP